jgi:hypothetical protein
MRKALFGLAAFAVLFVVSAGSASAAEGDAPKEIKGSAGCAMCVFAAETKAAACASSVKVGDTVYMLKASEKADDATKKLIASFSGHRCHDQGRHQGEGSDRGQRRGDSRGQVAIAQTNVESPEFSAPGFLISYAERR